jgi:glycosyltransferase involved in cell wall biosynthesis
VPQRYPFERIRHFYIFTEKFSLEGLLWYGIKSQNAVDISQSVMVVKELLCNTDQPILITRTHPIMCSMVGLKTYKFAYKWIAHFSDPIPWYGDFSDTLGHRLLKLRLMRIIRNAFTHADGISVTCMHVCKYYKELYGDAFDESKVFMTTHIGDYRLDAPPSPSDSLELDPILLHPGTIYARRGGTTIAEVMKQLSKEHHDVKFVQVGEVEGCLKDILVESENVIIHDTIFPEESVRLRKKAKAIFVPDFESVLSYSPFILSKFVYQIMSDKPIILYAKADSEMHDYALQYPEAGVYWAEAGNVDSLKEAIIKAMNVDVSLINRTGIRKAFSEDTIVGSFEESIRKIIAKDEYKK